LLIGGEPVIPIHRDKDYRFAFAEPRLIDRFHLMDVAEGVGVSVCALGSDGVPGVFLFEGTTGPGGWVQVEPPLRVDQKHGFVVTVQFQSL
jgi:hypothetical protein